MKSFGLNDGRPDGEIVVEVDDNGAVTSAKNIITNTEYVGGGIPFAIVKIKAYDTINNVDVNVDSVDAISVFYTDNAKTAISFNQSNSTLNVPIINNIRFVANDVNIIDENGSLYFLDNDTPIKSAVGNIEVEPPAEAVINGNCEITLNVIPD